MGPWAPRAKKVHETVRKQSTGDHFKQDTGPRNFIAHPVTHRSQRSPVTLSPPKGGESVTGSLSILFSGSLFEKQVPCFGDLERLGASTHGAEGVWVRRCAWVCRGVVTHPPPPTTHPQRSAHPTHLPTYLPTTRFIVLLIEVGAVTFSRQGQGKRER